MVSRLLFRASRSALAGPIVRFGFTYLSPLIPVRRLVTTRELTPFHHPRPSWDTHVLLVPRVGISNILDVRPARVGVIAGILRQARRIGREVYDGTGPMSLMVNGGRYQDVGQLHFHLIRGAGVAPLVSIPDAPRSAEAVAGMPHPDPQREFHHLFRLAMPEGVVREDFIPSDAQIRSLLDQVDAAVTRHELRPRGFTLVARANGSNLDYSTFHLISGS